MKTVLLLAAASLCAVGEPPALISGIVTDASQTPVRNARVVLTERAPGTRRVAFTNNQGEYRLGPLPPTDYVLQASAEGFGSSEPKELRVSGNQREDLRLELARVVSQVQVTASALTQTVDEQAKALDVVDHAEIERRGEFSVAEALRTVPGLRVQQLGGPGSFTRVLTRGTRAFDTAFLVDGFRLRDAASPQGDVSAFIGDLLVTDVDRLEVLRGSGSSLYGTHATAGVVNVITDQGGGTVRGDVSAEGGGLGLFRGTARTSGGAMQDRLRFSGGVTHLNVTSGVDEDDRARNSTIHGFAQYQVASRTTASVRLLLADTFAQLNDSPYLDPARRLVLAPDDPDQRRSARTVTALAQVRHIFSPWASVQGSYSGVGTRRDNRDGPAGIRFEPAFNNANRFDGRIDTAQLRTDFSLGRYHLLTAGYEWERESFDNLSTDENPNAARRTNARLRIAQRSHSGFAQIQGRYLEGRLQVQVSGRLQHFDLSRPRFSGNSTLYSSTPTTSPSDARTGDVSAAYMVPSTSTRVRAHLGNGYRAPALYERFGASFFGGSFNGYGDPRLAPERVLAFDTGIDQYLLRSRVRVSATYYYTTIQEQIIFDFTGLITPATDPFGRFGGYRNTRGGLARGVELSAEATPTRSLTLHGSYTLAKSLDRVSQYGTTELRSPRISEHVFTATASQRIGRRVDVTFDLFAASQYFYPLGGQAYRFDGPVRGDIAAGWTKPLGERRALRVFTRIENVFNRRYSEEGFRTPRAWAVGGVKWLF